MNIILIEGEHHSVHSFLYEIDRKNLVGKTKVQSPNRYNKRLGYKAGGFDGIDPEQLLANDLLATQVHVGDYICNVAYRGVLKRLLEVLREQPKPNVTLQSVIRAVTRAMDNTDIYVNCTCPDFCLHEDTMIKLLNNEVVSVKDLLNKFNNNEEIWVYSTDKNGDFKPGKVTDVWISGYSSKMIKVTLDNDKYVITTPNHKFMLRDGSYCEAQNLTKDMSLMPLYFSYHKVKSIEVIDYENPIPVYDLTVKNWNNFYVDAGVILHNCYRFAYWATKYDYKYGPPQNIPANKTNPTDNIGSVCKHLTALLSNKRWLVKVSSIVNNFIKSNIEDVREALGVTEDEMYVFSRKPKKSDNKLIEPSVTLDGNEEDIGQAPDIEIPEDEINNSEIEDNEEDEV